jgi:glucose-6-phosphate isomerase
MKQTAVEWLIEQMLKQGYFDVNKPLTFTNLDHLQQQAKAMEKEQMIQSFRKGAVVDKPEYYTWIESAYRKQAEKYYNETFKQD